MDPISDMLVKIKNAQTSGKESVSLPYSKIKMQIAKVLVSEKFIKEAEAKGKTNKTIEIVLLYGTDGAPVIRNISRISKVSKRIYVPLKKITSVKQGLGIRIMSTPKGLLTNKEAVKEKVGGEVICEVW